MKKRNQDSQINVKCMKEDLELLKIKSAKMGFKDVSKYVRFLIYQNKLRDPEIKEYYEEIIYELSKIGNNINQIAKNENSMIFTESDHLRMEAYLEKQKKLIADIRAELENSKG